MFSLIVPMYNEKKHIDTALTTLSSFLRENLTEEYEVLFVNDGSTDGAQAAVSSFPDTHFRLLSYEKNRGKGYAVRYGMLHATGELRVFTDCDLAYGVDAVLEMKKRMESEPDKGVFVASRALHPQGYEGYTWKRKLMSRTYLRLLRLICGIRVSDSQSGLKGFRAEAAEAVFPLCETDRFAFDIEALMIASVKGFSIGEMPASVIENEQSTIRLSDPLQMLRDLFAIRRRVKKIK